MYKWRAYPYPMGYNREILKYIWWLIRIFFIRILEPVSNKPIPLLRQTCLPLHIWHNFYVFWPLFMLCFLEFFFQETFVNTTFFHTTCLYANLILNKDQMSAFSNAELFTFPSMILINTIARNFPCKVWKFMLICFYS